ncbi:MAG: sulfatase-like hydrolase/transferase [Planctomycetes bacterium]|nr:sulfatase-like hydrolase/transferase [Planctomycetota bacterium]
MGLWLQLLLAGSLQPCVSEDPPNVVLIISDDQAWTDFGFMDHPVIETPWLDALAEESMVFPRGYVPTALCRASLATIITGLYAHEHQLTGNDPPRGVDRALMLEHIAAVDTLPGLLGEVGYKSLQTGKWWEGDCRCGDFTEGMTHGDPKRGGRHGDLGLKIGRDTMLPAFDFIDACSEAGDPFFLWYAPFLPHRPHNPPERLLEKYRGEGVTDSVARYYAMCEWFDETCGALLGHVEERGLKDDTLVVFVVDNGWIQREESQGYAPRSKRTPYEGGVRTPILLSWPGHIEPGVRSQAVSSVDLAPTILSVCGVEVPEALPGFDLLELEERGPVFGAAFTHDVVKLGAPEESLLTRWVLDDRHKLLVHDDPSRPTELYDVALDPTEESPLTSPETERALRAQLDAWWIGRQPNLLVVVTDDQRYDQLGCEGHPVLETPVMDRLAAEGVRFKNSFVTTAICAASRASLMTSQREGSHGYTFGTPAMGAAIADDTYFARLKDAGYRTGFVGKWGVRYERGVMRDHIDTFRQMSPPYLRPKDGDVDRHLTDRTADEAIRFLREGGDEPFCLTLSFNAPHAEDPHPEQFIPPRELDALYAGAEVAVPPLSAPEVFEALPEFMQSSLNRVRWGWRFDTREKQTERTLDYWRMISGVDMALGRVLAALQEGGHAEDTVVVFTSDNGYFLGERGFAGKWLIYEESVRVPLIIFDPRVGEERRGQVLDEMVLNLDLAPTLLALAGVEAPETYEGRSLIPLLRGQSEGWRTDFLYEHRFAHEQIPQSEGVRGERFVYVRYYEEEPAYEQLFDLERDPMQLKNLALSPHRESFEAELMRMRARCDELLSR